MIVASWQNGLFSNWSRDPTSAGALYAAAAVLIPSIVPFTLVVIMPTNNKLMAAAAKPGVLSESDTRNLVQRWKQLNLIRASIFGALGAVLATTATAMS